MPRYAMANYSWKLLIGKSSDGIERREAVDWLRHASQNKDSCLDQQLSTLVLEAKRQAAANSVHLVTDLSSLL